MTENTSLKTPISAKTKRAQLQEAVETILADITESEIREIVDQVDGTNFFTASGKVDRDALRAALLHTINSMNLDLLGHIMPDQRLLKHSISQSIKIEIPVNPALFRAAAYYQPNPIATYNKVAQIGQKRFTEAKLFRERRQSLKSEKGRELTFLNMVAANSLEENQSPPPHVPEQPNLNSNESSLLKGSQYSQIMGVVREVYSVKSITLSLLFNLFVLARDAFSATKTIDFITIQNIIEWGVQDLFDEPYMNIPSAETSFELVIEICVQLRTLVERVFQSNNFTSIAKPPIAPITEAKIITQNTDVSLEEAARWNGENIYNNSINITFTLGMLASPAIVFFPIIDYLIDRITNLQSQMAAAHRLANEIGFSLEKMEFSTRGESASQNWFLLSVEKGKKAIGALFDEGGLNILAKTPRLQVEFDYVTTIIGEGLGLGKPLESITLLPKEIVVKMEKISKISKEELEASFSIAESVASSQLESFQAIIEKEAATSNTISSEFSEYQTTMSREMTSETTEDMKSIDLNLKARAIIPVKGVVIDLSASRDSHSSTAVTTMNEAEIQSEAGTEAKLSETIVAASKVISKSVQNSVVESNYKREQIVQRKIRKEVSESAEFQSKQITQNRQRSAAVTYVFLALMQKYRVLYSISNPRIALYHPLNTHYSPINEAANFFTRFFESGAEEILMPKITRVVSNVKDYQGRVLSFKTSGFTFSGFTSYNKLLKFYLETNPATPLNSPTELLLRNYYEDITGVLINHETIATLTPCLIPIPFISNNVLSPNEDAWFQALINQEAQTTERLTLVNEVLAEGKRYLNQLIQEGNTQKIIDLLVVLTSANNADAAQVLALKNVIIGMVTGQKKIAP